MQVDIRKLNVYFLDIGLREWVPMHNIRSLPREFFSQPAVAIPCRLFDAHPVYANEPSVWKLDDAVHDEFHQVITNTVNCQVCDFRENLYYDVSIEISSKRKRECLRLLQRSQIICLKSLTRLSLLSQVNHSVKKQAAYLDLSHWEKISAIVARSSPDSTRRLSAGISMSSRLVKLSEVRPFSD